ncbi:tRNA (adenine22-N1)-methyltransferase [Sedimentibacter acidaminivorans]|jgi:tRNA (adenine22-N1)-methyltransferase|uniref:tRNA (Adenine22-N1)-methyltransferase n=1 Tax=Sedimentibacter acidaminivorans TaxID=913099 RepID=A0ABS4GCL2_9FIRM|nr:class I SAM-dependent methyltransferase [Sedimentibacter acidaminivorans]MBP1925436.1 tRNA (adenine22-N1)-methyltransferase [Sedimentibacter acidaminivorans]
MVKNSTTIGELLVDNCTTGKNNCKFCGTVHNRPFFLEKDNNMNRLEAIKSMVSKCNVVADIGTDHGYVAEMLLKDNTVKKVIATDLNKGPLNRAIEYLTTKNLDEKCDFRLGSGLEILNEKEADCIIIAGMGGELIRDILKTSKKVSLEAKQLVLQPMTAIDKLRKYLIENNYIISDEIIVKELHHFYFIIKANPISSDINNKSETSEKDEIFYEISKPLLEKKDIIMGEYINKIISTNNLIIHNLEKQNNNMYKEKIENLKNKNNKIMELKKYYEI